MELSACGCPGTDALEALGAKFYEYDSSLDLTDARVTDADLAHLGYLPGLVKLKLGTEVSNAGLIHPAELSNLKSLNLSYTKVTDTGLIHLAELSNLKSLDLSHTEVTDTGLIHLGQLASLEELVLDDTQVTNKGLAFIRAIFPNICIR